jgi:hypothetical protein
MGRMGKNEIPRPEPEPRNPKPEIRKKSQAPMTEPMPEQRDVFTDWEFDSKFEIWDLGFGA